MGVLLAFYSFPYPNSLADTATSQVASLVFIGPVQFPKDNAWIQDNVVYKPNFADIEEFQPPPVPKSKKIYRVYATLIDETILLPDDLSTGDKVGDGECVTFAKAYLGLSGTWGYGGVNLSKNSGPEVGTKQNPVVVLFYGHVGVIIGMQADGGLILIESNYHLNHRVLMGRIVYIGDPSIRGYHKF